MSHPAVPDPRGWAVFPADATSRLWASAARTRGARAARDPGLRHWWRHGRTWFAGVGVLENGRDGAVAGIPFDGPGVRAIGWRGGWDAGQVSIVRPGYPGRDPGESDAAHRYRLRRDAAHVDGLLPVGPDRRRMLREPHAFILGVPLTEAGPGASPLVVWEGSHDVMRQAFRARLDGIPPDAWPDTDITDAYHRARKEVFETCRRVEILAKPGESIWLHRLALHGIAPWADGSAADEEGRMIAYFRPETSRKDWLFAP